MIQTTQYLENKLSKINYELSIIADKLAALGARDKVVFNSESYQQGKDFYISIEFTDEKYIGLIKALCVSELITFDGVDNSEKLIFNLDVC